MAHPSGKGTVSRRATLLALSVVFAGAVAAWATPVRGQWTREILLGANATAVFTLRIAQSQPGSHYERFEEWTLRERPLPIGAEAPADEPMESTVTVRRARFLADMDDDAAPWTEIEETSSTLSLRDWLAQRRIEPTRPMKPLREHRFLITDDGLALERKGRRATVLPMAALRDQLEPPTFGWDTWSADRCDVLDEMSEGHGFLFLRVRDYEAVGRDFSEVGMEEDFFESVVAVKRKSVDEAVKRLKKDAGAESSKEGLRAGNFL